MRVGFIFVVLGFMALPMILLAQNAKPDSVVQLQQVSVYAQNLQRDLVGNKIIYPTQIAQSYHEGGSMNDLLQQQPSIYIKSYGNGMLSSIAFRGTTASQTSVIWNGFNINNYTLGQMDFSLLPVFPSDELLILPGGGSTYGGNGAIGGTITMNSPLQYSQEHQLGINTLAGSFGKYQTAINYAGSAKKLAFKTTLYQQEAENDFYIPSLDQRQPNAAFVKYGVKQQLGYQLADDRKIELAIWYHHNDRENQPAIRKFNVLTYQRDDNFRSSLKYLHSGTNYNVQVGSGYFNDQLAYEDGQQISIYKTSRSENFIELDLFPFEKHRFTMEARANLIAAQSAGYNPKRQMEQRYSWKLKASGVFFEHLNYAAHIGQQVVSQTDLKPLTPYIGLMYPVIKGDHQQLKVKANMSYNFRVPTLNDRFWEITDRQPILPERALNLETGISYSIHQMHYNWKINATIFNNKITNYIQWEDVDGQARPKNIDDVEIKGVELESNFIKYFTKSFNAEIGVGYAYNNAKSLAEEAAHHLVYVPQHKLNAFVNFKYQQFQINYFANYTSKLYTTVQNKAAFTIPAFSVHDVGAAYNFSQLSTTFKVKNLFNSSYQTYLNYAMPGRHFELSINYTININ